MNARNCVVALVTLVVVSTVLTPAVAAQTADDGQVIGWPDLSVTTATPELTPGADQSLTLELLNDPELRQAGPERFESRVTTARVLTLEIDDSELPFDVRSESVAVGSVPPGKTTLPPVTVTVPESAAPGTYDVPVELTYSYTRLVSYDGDDVSYANGRRTVDDEVTVRIDSRARFAVTGTRSTLQVGDTGRVTVTLENVGTARARTARVSLTAPSGDAQLAPITENVSTAGGPSGSPPAVYVGTWRPGETRSASYTVTLDEEIDAEALALRATVAYEDTDGIARTSPPLSFGVDPTPEQSFALDDVESSLRVGRTGTLSGSLVNTGETEVSDVVVVLSTGSPELVPQPARVAVSDLEPGESASFAFDIRVADAATATTQPADLTVRYRNQRGQRRQSDSLERPLEIAPQRDRFAFTPVNATFAVDTENRLVARITNRQSVTVREVQVRINATAPFTSESSTAYVDALTPGESALVAFQVTVSEDAVPTTTAVDATVTARDPDGDRIRDGPYVIEATVTEPSGPGNTALLGGGVVAVVLILGAGWWWLRR